MCNGLVKYGVQMVALTTYGCVFLSLGLIPAFPLSLSPPFLCLPLQFQLPPSFSLAPEATRVPPRPSCPKSAARPGPQFDLVSRPRAEPPPAS